MINNDYIIIKAEENNVKVITKKINNEENLEIINQGEVLILKLCDEISNFKISGRARVVSKLDQVIAE